MVKLLEDNGGWSVRGGWGEGGRRRGSFTRWHALVGTPRLSYREQYKVGDEKADRENERKTMEWNIILRKAENLEEWRKLVVKSPVVPQRAARLRDR